jgi:hypothetical protein
MTVRQSGIFLFYIVQGTGSIAQLGRQWGGNIELIFLIWKKVDFVAYDSTTVILINVVPLRYPPYRLA